MQHKTLDYETPEPRNARPSLVALAAVAPFVMFAAYFFGTIALYGFLNNRDARPVEVVHRRPRSPVGR